jgi:hypothetical protein
MKTYYKIKSNFSEGPISQYVEVENSWAVRQVDYYKGEWFFCSTTTNSQYLCDKPFENLSEMEEDRIEASEFEKVWEASAIPASVLA